jgi:hypothetical protein
MKCLCLIKCPFIKTYFPPKKRERGNYQAPLTGTVQAENIGMIFLCILTLPFNYMNGTKVKAITFTHHMPRLLFIDGWYEQV